MKKEYEITDQDGNYLETVFGYCYKDFGIHKDNEGDWQVTHFITGGGCGNFIFLRQARDYVKRMEQALFPIPWDKVTTHEQAYKNKDIAYTLFVISKDIT